MTDFKLFQKPQRYIGNEWNVIKKHHSGKIKICICYPSSYEVGMSNLGLRIIYGLLNDYGDVVCERAFFPGVDYARFLKQKRKKLTSLETKTALDEFEILGFNFNYELNFPNFLHILHLGGVPLRAEARKNLIVMGGGIVNPEPLANFVDLFCLGEFEEVADKFIDILRRFKIKEDRLRALSEIDGFYVPKFYSSSLINNKYIFDKIYPYAKLPLKKVYVRNLDESFYPLKWLVPHTSIVHDRVQVEIARGCPNKCTFCQAQAQYSPYRERKVSTLTDMVRKIFEFSGYENFSFLSLSASDYSHIESLVDEVIDYSRVRKIGLSLPSLRVDDIVGRLYKKLIPLKKTSLTLAVEAALPALRNELNKRLDIGKFFEAAKIIHSLGIKHIKIYFMFGFPQEDDEDLIGIGQFLRRLRQEAKLILNVSINIFVPKPFSSWEAVPMQEESILNAKRKIILESIPRNEPIKPSFSYPQKSILEAVISRGDRRLSSVIYRVYSKEAELGEYGENFSWDIWDEAFKEEGIDYRFYLEAKTENFPWSFIASQPRAEACESVN
ncbi:MAG: TIGR03960 family B12-binding radical SAM protein [Candidatus Omnitrophica bacterium]|nr:TIGR03960 family B12-binding radical SAM protein [Candidatus Omnitrophota bacterium]MBU0879086.1 TIGR03960 family B12-binding radical SAM protein [Candidatus Omnitrophota bacterium]MBU0896292.1 TIGR03960 family B12-binding radical SAM protein [Candidatus Omnitrophota bacterium]MBU1134612.1 TIGR03960 family B12-binding radical SAM protein [Candidatus Omnitrophota bacterium]MBU1524239.1 TIGR03960 family B12-binding radical SAM protein [Candidatus Omnitrophota bacterium]